MSTTFGDLKTEVSAAIRDPDGKTFDATAVGRLVNAALVEVGRIMPEQFQEDITPLADTIEYTPRTLAFGGANPDIEVARVEVWDGSTIPATRSVVIPAAGAGYASDSEAGWSMWGGVLYLPSYAFGILDGNEDTLLLRLWGYSPYVALAADDDVANLSNDAYWALVARARVEAYERLNNDRSLFTQWQTRSGNSDISPAGLMNELSGARDEWRRMSRSLLRLRALV